MLVDGQWTQDWQPVQASDAKGGFVQSAPDQGLFRTDRAVETMLAVPGVRDTVNMDHIKRGYHSIKALNPNGVVPLGPDLPELGF